MLLLKDYTKVNLANNFLKLNDQGGVVGKFDMAPWLADNATALEDNAEGVGLKVRVLTSMSGVLINRRVYPGIEWKKAAPFFAERPFLMHHNSYGDAVGRISDGEFEQKRTGRSFENDFKRPKAQELGKTPRPSGIIYVNGIITDPAIIEQANDKRVFHVSQGSRAKIGQCSICDSDMAKHEWCDHRPGLWYSKETGDQVTAGSEKSEEAFTIIRDLIPVEVSFVTDPALAAARIMELEGVNDAETMQRWNDYTSEINTTDTILEDDVTEMTLMGIDGTQTRVRVVHDATTEIITPASKPETTEKTNETEEAPKVDNSTNHPQNDSADTSPVTAKSSDNGAKKMEWEAKYTETADKLIASQFELKEAQLDADRTKMKLDSEEAKSATLASDIESRDEKIAALEEGLKDADGANKKLLDEVRSVFLDRYEVALKISRPDLKDEEVAEARELLSDKALDAVKLVVADKEKFAKAPSNVETAPAKVNGDAGEINQDAAPAANTDSNEGHEEEDDDGFSL